MNTRYKQFNWITDKESKKIAKRWNTRRPRPGREIFHVPTKCYDDRCNQTMILGKDNQGNYFLAVYNEKQERVK